MRAAQGRELVSDESWIIGKRCDEGCVEHDRPTVQAVSEDSGCSLPKNISYRDCYLDQQEKIILVPNPSPGISLYRWSAMSRSDDVDVQRMTLALLGILRIVRMSNLKIRKTIGRDVRGIGTCWYCDVLYVIDVETLVMKY